MSDSQAEARQQRENAVKQRAVREQRAITYIDDDGCEVTVLPSGHALYNAADWW